MVEFDPSYYTVNEDDRSVTFMIVKRTPTILSVTVNFSTVPGTAKGSVTLLMWVFLISNHFRCRYDPAIYLTTWIMSAIFPIRFSRLCPKEHE